MCNKVRSDRSLQLMYTLIQFENLAIQKLFPLILTNQNVIVKLQNAVVGGLNNVSLRSIVVGETIIFYYEYDMLKKNVYSIHTDTSLSKLLKSTSILYTPLRTPRYTMKWLDTLVIVCLCLLIPKSELQTRMKWFRLVARRKSCLLLS
jgi:hypothetical protein